MRWTVGTKVFNINTPGQEGRVRQDFDAEDGIKTDNPLVAIEYGPQYQFGIASDQQWLEQNGWRERLKN